VHDDDGTPLPALFAAAMELIRARRRVRRAVLAILAAEEDQPWAASGDLYDELTAACRELVSAQEQHDATHPEARHG
jgi:hypothetical protein